MSKNEAERCPKCGERKVLPIVYGLPGEDLFEAAERKEVFLGGCVISDDDPVWQCGACGAAWGKR